MEGRRDGGIFLLYESETSEATDQVWQTYEEG